jgi:hypothetical protein
MLDYVLSQDLYNYQLKLEDVDRGFDVTPYYMVRIQWGFISLKP